MPQYNLIEHQVEQSIISQRASDGYVNATAMCQAAGKSLEDYVQSPSTQDFIDELAYVEGIAKVNIIQDIQEGDPQLRGVWVHPDVAINLAQWCSPQFAVMVSRFVREWLEGTHTSQTQLRSWQHFHDRVDMTKNSVPPGYFGIFHEIASMVVPMIHSGVELNDHTMPDISVGQTWARYWKDKKLATTHGERINYPHTFPEYYPQAANGIVDAYCYPDTALGDFRKWFRENYLTKNLPNYIAGKQKKGHIAPSTANTLIDTFALKKLDK